MDIIKDKLQNKVFKEEGLKKAIKIINPYLKYKLIKSDSELTNFVTAIFNKAKEDFDDFNFTCIDYKTLRENNNLIKSLINLELAYAGSCDFDNNIKFNTTAIAFKTLKMGYSADLISIGLISSIFHEIEHAKQNKREILDVQSYRIAKEKYMIDNSKVYSKYYKFFEMEIDANIKGLLEAYKLMISYDSYYLKYNKYMDFLMKEYIKLRDELEYEIVEDEFDKIIDNNKYPFNIEYDENGKRKELKDLVNNKLEDENLYYHIIYNATKNYSKDDILNSEFKDIIINAFKKEIRFNEESLIGDKVKKKIM